MSTNDLTTPAAQQAHDKATAEAWTKANRLAARYETEHRHTQEYVLRSYTPNYEATLEALAAKDAPTTTGAAERLTKAHDAAVDARDAFQALEDQYAGWARFFLVPGGHIHSSMTCSTCNHRGKTTAFQWLPELSGLDEEAAVKAQGKYLCTTCFPSAPVEWTNGREEEAAAKAATYCDGSGTTDWVEGSTRFGYAAGNGGTCSHCGRWASATSTRKIRKHKPTK